MTPDQRERFDRLLERIIEELPEHLRALLDEAPLIVDDEPGPALSEELGIEPGELICGLHSGVPLNERSVEHPPELPMQIHIFRRGIIELVGGMDGPEGESGLIREIRITLLHEIGHHFGLDEDDLAELGYD